MRRYYLSYETDKILYQTCAVITSLMEWTGSDTTSAPFLSLMDRAGSYIKRTPLLPPLWIGQDPTPNVRRYYLSYGWDRILHQTYAVITAVVARTI